MAVQCTLSTAKGTAKSILLRHINIHLHAHGRVLAAQREFSHTNDCNYEK